MRFSISIIAIAELNLDVVPSEVRDVYSERHVVPPKRI